LLLLFKFTRKGSHEGRRSSRNEHMKRSSGLSLESKIKSIYSCLHSLWLLGVQIIPHRLVAGPVQSYLGVSYSSSSRWCVMIVHELIWGGLVIWG
jgi:hypothetical protein